MKTTLLILSFALAQLSACLQNLVPNPGFELLSDTTATVSFELLNWFPPECGGTPDNLHALYNEVWAPKGVPDNIHGNQYPHSGNGYAGFGTWEEGYLTGEYAEVQLLDELVQDSTYIVSCWLNLAENSSYVTDKLSWLFSANEPSACNGDDTLFYASQSQITMLSLANLGFEDWVFFEGEFIAAGGEEYLILGDFTSIYDQTPVFIGNNAIPLYTYFYIDDVEVKPKYTTQVDQQSCVNFNVIVQSEMVLIETPLIGKISIFDSNGKLIVDSFPVSPGQNHMNLKNESEGIHLFLFNYDHGLSAKKVLILKV